MDIKKYLAAHKEQIDKALISQLNDDLIPDALKKAMEYSLKAGGKRLRPILVIAGGEAVGGRSDELIPLACALEMIHTFSLIHDDLPAMDDDDLRRGQPTNHKVFGEATAILAGDALLAEAFLLISTADFKRDPKMVLEIIQDVARATGARGMTGGQQIDMDSAGVNLSATELTKLHTLKTGRLITVAATSGAKYCGASKTQVTALGKYGEAIGLAFQIADDILDIEGNQDEIGKDVGSDVDNKKATYPAVIGIEQSRRQARKLVEDAVSALSTFDQRADPLREIAKFVIERRK